MNIDSINTASPFRDLFPVEDELVKKLYWDMQKNGFDTSKPIVVWKGKSVVIDGHTRLRAARKAGLYDVPVVMKDFEDVEDALEYAIKSQRNRRNLADKEIIQCIAALDKKRDRGGDHGNQYTGGKEAKATSVTFAKSSNETGRLLGINYRKVEKARVVLDKAPEEVKDAVKSGKISINSAYNKIRDLSPSPQKGTPESIQLAAEEIAKIDAVIDIIKERLTKEQIKELIKKLEQELTNK